MFSKLSNMMTCSKSQSTYSKSQKPKKILFTQRKYVLMDNLFGLVILMESHSNMKNF